MTDPYIGRRRQAGPASGPGSVPAEPGYRYAPGQYGQQPAGQDPYAQGQPYYPDQQQYPNVQPYRDGQPPPRRRKKRRVFLWVFLVIQALFILWLVGGLATTQTGPSHAQLVSACYNHNWWPLYKSQSDCVTHYGATLTAAGNVGKGIGAALIVVLWAVVDIILGISYGVYRLATRDR